MWTRQQRAIKSNQDFATFSHCPARSCHVKNRHGGPSLQTETHIRALLDRLQVEVGLACVGLRVDVSRWDLRQYFRRGDTLCPTCLAPVAWLDLKKRKISTPPVSVLEGVSALPRAEDFADIPA